jgi:predicted DCC family thiol-disulfide oxidoreductase YuxK
MSADRTPILYDADCGFCRASLALVLAWDRRQRLRPVALQGREAGQLLRGMPLEQRMASWHLVQPGGAVRSAGDAAAPLLRLLPGGGPLASLVARHPAGTEGVYGWVARHRGTLGRPIPRAAVRRADALIRSRSARDRL